MQIKIVIGTIAFMMTMMVFGYAALREPARLEQFTAAAEGRSIEEGAEIFANNCATCHGADGTAQSCFDAAGNQITCQGLPLNSNGLLCGDVSASMLAQGWDGTKHDFVLRTVAAGRGPVMPTWAEEFGGPFRPDQVQNVTNFVLNWETEELCSQPVVTFPWAETVEEFLAEQVEAEGDAANGEQLFAGTYGCIACHGNPQDEAAQPPTVGPSLANIAEEGATRVEGESAAQYVYHSILYPSDFIAPDCPSGPCAGPPSVMPNTFAASMGNNPQDMADILAYLLGE
jgi:mono/diheme cytochrome c family protein